MTYEYKVLIVNLAKVDILVQVAGVPGGLVGYPRAY